ncbi:DUF6119 family protein [Chloroflexota bacterium]
MANTANVKIYHIREDVDIDQLVEILERKYETFDLGDTIRQAQNVEIRAFQKSNNSSPDWYHLIYPYLSDKGIFYEFKRYDLVILVKTQSKDDQKHTFAYCAGSGYFDIEQYIDNSFGIFILETVFDPNINRIKAISEKGVTGDVLAALRFYRRPRPVAYENNFGKHYQRINTSFTHHQIQEKFPLFAGNKGQKLKPVISVTGSTSIDIQSRVTLPELILVTRDVSELIRLKPKPVFNTTLDPVDVRKERNLINHLNRLAFGKLADFLLNPITCPMDFDFCPNEFDEFFRSSICQFDFNKFNSTSGENIVPIQFDDVYSISDSSHFDQLLKRIQVTAAYRKEKDKKTFLSNVLQSIEITTQDDEGRTTTSGPLRDYLQLEIEAEGKPYFLLDKYWYLLQYDFDKALMENYINRVASKIRDYEFMKKWNTGNEADYNKTYNNQPYSFCLHQINVEHIELCDIMFVDSKNTVAYLIHVKDGIGATIRDLTSQVLIASHIVEGELQAGRRESLERLYDQAALNNRIDSNIVGKSDFLSWLQNFRREYVLAVHCENKSPQDILQGNFESRIAKFCLVEFASQMRSNDYNFSICCV